MIQVNDAVRQFLNSPQDYANCFESTKDLAADLSITLYWSYDTAWKIAEILLPDTTLLEKNYD